MVRGSDLCGRLAVICMGALLAVMLYGRLAGICMGGWQSLVWEADRDLYGRLVVICMGWEAGSDL